MDLNFPSPPEWSLWVGSLGRLFVWLAIGSYALSLIGWLFAPKGQASRKVGAWGFTAGSLCLFATFACLAVLFANNRFEFEYVWSHADKLNTIPYRIAGIWSGQQGSFLLWGVAAAIFGLLAVRRAGDFRRWFTIPYAAFLCGIAAILAYESPYGLNVLDGKAVVPPDGVGLAPSLQNYWVIIHPPTIFLGFGSLTVLFAFAFAAMATRDFSSWIPRVRPWAILSVSIVGVGLCMGGFWAYETLGWGGFWAWDPVENTSFVPWCLGVCLIHGMIVQTTKNKWKGSNLLFAGLPFLAFLYGTFLTRSGFLGETSVHSFAEMDSIALLILAGIGGVAALSFLILWIVSLFIIAATKPIEEPTKGIHREGMYRAGNFILILFAFATAVGMSIPVINTLLGQGLAVATERNYHMILAWPFVPLLLLMAVAPFIRWNGDRVWTGLGKLYGSFCITIGLLGIFMLVISRTAVRDQLDLEQWIQMPFGYQAKLLPWMMFLIGLCLFAAVANTWRIVEMFKRGKTSLPAFFAHVGVATLLAGLIISRGFERKAQLIVQEGTPAQGLGYTVSYVKTTKDLMDRNNKVIFEMQGPDGKFEVNPGLYYRRNRNTGESDPMVWPHVEHNLFHDVYFTLHPMQLNASEVITLKPGQTGRFDRFDVKFVKATREGEPGKVGTKFGALLDFGSGEHKLSIEPKMVIGDGAVRQEPAVIADEYFMTMQGMDAATGAVHLQLHFLKPLYPIELFYKPMTILVWGGTGILTLAGFWAAWNRRRAAVVVPEKIEAERIPEPVKEPHAPAPAAQV